ncbi:MAG: putative diheme cytochrome c-553 [Labilithrix sp.]|nr:putative diheme cytochrome c-553 [Labilithrix sp.]
MIRTSMKLGLMPVLGLLALAACTNDKPLEAAGRPESAVPSTQKEPPAVAAAATHADLVKRGEQLVKMGGCSDCHTPMAFDAKLGIPVPQMDRFLSGHPEGAPDPSASPGKNDQAVIGPTFTSFRLPFGVVYAQNLTSDPETGLRMDKAQFIATMRTGKHRGAADGRPVLPPMPWMNLQNASEEDLGAMHAYLGSIKPVKNAVPEPKVPPPVIAAMAKLNSQMAAAAAPKGTASPL